MKFINLKVRYKDSIREFSFNGNNVLIYSEDNSVGKSTLLRILFYSLGYPIPGTLAIRFQKLFLELDFSIFGKVYKVIRHDKRLELIFGKEKKDYLLPNQHEYFLKQIFDTEEVKVINNIIGAMYLDQDKGWTLLNRGKVIGNIHFNIEELIEGLTSIDVTEYTDRISFLNRELRRLKNLKSIISYQELYLENEVDFPSDDINFLKEQIVLLSSQKKIYLNKMKQVDKLKKENNAFFKLLENFDLKVEDKNTGNIISVNKDTIINYNDNYNFLEARKWLLKESICNLEKELSDVKNKLINLMGQTYLFENDNSIEKADVFFNQIDVNHKEIDSRIELINDELEHLRNYVKNKLIENSEVVTRMSGNILRYATELGVNNIISGRKGFIFTSDLKKISGTQFHKLVICYKLAYIKELERFIGTSLPIVLDSPSGREVTKDNLDKIYQLLSNELDNNQVIIASIYKNKFINATELIELNENDKIFGISNPIFNERN